MVVSRTEDLLNAQVHLNNSRLNAFVWKCKCKLERGTEDYRIFTVKLILATNVLAVHMALWNAQTTDYLGQLQQKWAVKINGRIS